MPRFDKSLGRTVLFAVAVVFFVVGVYQTLVQNDLLRNYWLFMVSFGCIMAFRYLAADKKPAEPPAKAGAKIATKRPAGKSKNKRKK